MCVRVSWLACGSPGTFALVPKGHLHLQRYWRSTLLYQGIWEPFKAGNFLISL
jgi:hypothetical protein